MIISMNHYSAIKSKASCIIRVSFSILGIESLFTLKIIMTRLSNSLVNNNNKYY